jgi:hypothetical protein
MSSSSSQPAQGSISPNCPCDVSTSLPPLQAAAHPYDNTAIVFTLSPNQQFIPSISKTGHVYQKAWRYGKEVHTLSPVQRRGLSGADE